MRRPAALLLCCAACATSRQQEIVPPLPARLVDPGECVKDGGAACYEKGRALLESRNPASAQESMEYIDASCAAGLEKACDLSDLAFKAPRRIAGRNPHTTPQVRQDHVSGTVSVRCILGTDGLLRDCTVLQSVKGMDAQVLDSAASRRYQPATWGGNPVEIPFDIQLDVNP
jgi:TonB family protein